MDAIDALAAEHALFSELFVIPSEQVSLRTLKHVPEIALCRATLERGIEDLFFVSKVDPGGAAKIRRDAKQWMMANHHDDPMSFVSLCDLFHFDIACLRNGLLNLLSKGINLTIQKED